MQSLDWIHLMSISYSLFDEWVVIVLELGKALPTLLCVPIDPFMSLFRNLCGQWKFISERLGRGKSSELASAESLDMIRAFLLTAGSIRARHAFGYYVKGMTNGWLLLKAKNRMTIYSGMRDQAEGKDRRFILKGARPP